MFLTNVLQGRRRHKLAHNWPRQRCDAELYIRSLLLLKMFEGKQAAPLQANPWRENHPRLATSEAALRARRERLRGQRCATRFCARIESVCSASEALGHAGFSAGLPAIFSSLDRPHQNMCHSSFQRGKLRFFRCFTRNAPTTRCFVTNNIACITRITGASPQTHKPKAADPELDPKIGPPDQMMQVTLII